MQDQELKLKSWLQIPHYPFSWQCPPSLIPQSWFWMNEEIISTQSHPIFLSTTRLHYIDLFIWRGVHRFPLSVRAPDCLMAPFLALCWRETCCRTGFAGKQLTVDCSDYVLRVQAEDSPPLIERAFDQPVDTCRPIESFKYGARTVSPYLQRLGASDLMYTIFPAQISKSCWIWWVVDGWHWNQVLRKCTLPAWILYATTIPINRCRRHMQSKQNGRQDNCGV